MSSYSSNSKQGNAPFFLSLSGLRVGKCEATCWAFLILRMTSSAPGDATLLLWLRKLRAHTWQSLFKMAQLAIPKPAISPSLSRSHMSLLPFARNLKIIFLPGSGAEIFFSWVIDEYVIADRNKRLGKAEAVHRSHPLFLVPHQAVTEGDYDIP